MELPSVSTPYGSTVQVSPWEVPMLPQLPAPEPTASSSASSIYDSDEPCQDSKEPVSSLSGSDSEEPASSSPVPKPKDFRNGREAKDNDVFIAVMGVTGSGKSSFISTCSDEPAKVGHTLEACTSAVDVYPCKFFPDRTIFLIDTPGFDDTDKSDTEVLREIAAWLADSYKSKILLHGIIYLHRITDVRMQGSAKRNLTLFKKLCGDDALKRVILATTMWDRVEREVAIRREEELVSTEEFWGWMVGKGSRVHQHHNEKATARQIINQLVEFEAPGAVSLQKQLVDDGLTLDKTSAGVELQSELVKERERWKKELEEVEKNMKTAMEEKDAETEKIMGEERDRYTSMIKKAEGKTAALRLTVENLITQRDKRVARMERDLRWQQTAQERVARMERELQSQQIAQEELRLEKIQLQKASEQEKQTKQAAGGRIPNATSKLGETFPPVSVSTFGSDYSLTSLICSKRNTPAPKKRASDGIKASATVVGDEESWVTRYSDGTWGRSKYFERYYPHLDAKFKPAGDDKLAFCALGADEQYYARWLDGTWSCYAHKDTVTAIKAVVKTCKKKNACQIRSVALGYGNTYTISYKSARKRRYKSDLKTFYPQLRQHLDEHKALNILAITLNPRNGYDYILVYSERDGSYGISWYCLDPGMDKEIREWTEKTLGKEMSE